MSALQQKNTIPTQPYSKMVYQGFFTFESIEIATAFLKQYAGDDLRATGHNGRRIGCSSIVSENCHYGWSARAEGFQNGFKFQK